MKDVSRKRTAEKGSTENGHVQWLRAFALLGDSGLALTASFLILLVAVAISLSLDSEDSWLISRASSLWTTNKRNDPYNRLGPIPSIGKPHIFVLEDDSPVATENMLEAYRKDGVIAVRGLIDDALLQTLDEESANIVLEQQGKTPRKRKTQFHTVSHGVLFKNSSKKEDSWSPGPFWTLALGSRVSSLAAQLLQGEISRTNEDTAKNLRVFRDILLSKDDDEYVCGWHVDDLGFWPATPEGPGINAWIALDDMPIQNGGGFALAVGSHAAPWREEAHLATGASTIFPDTGYRSAKDMLSQRTGSGTCNLEHATPHLHRRMEETKRVYPVQRGDVIFHTRWLFHRTVAFDRGHVAESDGSLVYRRYSIRYSPGSASIPPGYGTEWSVLWDEENVGRTADEVCQNDGPWYPQAWPEVSETERRGVANLVATKFPVAEQLRKSRQQEMNALLKKQSMHHHHRTPKH